MRTREALPALWCGAMSFELGRVVATPTALQRALEHYVDVFELLARHRAGDWGDTCAQDKRTNDAALKNGARILSVYGTGASKLWIITDAETDACPACVAGVGVCEPDKGEWHAGMHFRPDQPLQRLSTTVLCPEDY
jgi:hypothetical protein